jgi:hypothetical protein
MVERRFTPAGAELFASVTERKRLTPDSYGANSHKPALFVLLFPWHHGTRYGAATMPISRLLKNGNIKLEEVERLDRAFAFTLRSLGLVDRNDPVCEIVARKVIEIDAAGTHDPKEIAETAVRQLGIPR